MKKILITIGIVMAAGLGWLFIEKLIPPFGGTVEVVLTRNYAYTDVVYSTVSGELESGTYVYLPTGINHLLASGDYRINDGKKIYRSNNRPKDLTEVTVVGEKSFDVFINPKTSERVRYEITKAEYTALGEKNAVPVNKKTKTITEKISFLDVLKDKFGIKTAYASISRHSPVGFNSSASATSLTFAYDTGTATNRVLVLGINQGSPLGTNTYNGVSFGTAKISSALQVSQTAIFEMDDPATGSNNVVVNQSPANFWDVSVVSYDDAGTSSATKAANGASGAPTLTITTNSNNSMVFDNLALIDTGCVFGTGTPGTGQNEIHDACTGTAYIRFDNSDIQKVVAGDQVMSWSAAQGGWDYTAIEITEQCDGPCITGGAKPRRIIIE